MKWTKAILVSGLAMAMLVGCASEPKETSVAATKESEAKETAVQTEAAKAEATYELRMGHSQAPDHPFNDTCEYFAKLVSERTNGDVEINVFPNGQLGDEATMLESCSMGTLDLLMANGANTAALVPELGFLGVCYLFDNGEHIARVTADQEVFDLYSQIIESKNLNIKLLNLMGNGMRHLYTTKPVSSLEDLQGMKIRVMPSAVDVKVWNTLGANATTVAFSEVYSALQTNMVSGAENTFSSYASSKHNEVAPYVTLTGHQWLVTELWASGQVLSKLPEEYVDIIYEAAQETAVYSMEHQLEVDNEYRKQLEAAGTTFIEIDTKPWKETITPLHAEIARELDCEAVLEKINELR